MNQITCNVCMDLMPLVKDGIASSESCALVMTHLTTCESCTLAFGHEVTPSLPMDETAILNKIKKQLSLFLLGLIFMGMLVGMALSDSIGMFYNTLIMPVIGGFGYILLKKNAYFLPLALFVFAFAWVGVREILRGFLSYSTMLDLLAMSAFWAVIFAAFSVVGVFIAKLLHFAFKKER